MLALEVEYLAGVCFAALPQANPTQHPDWPPQPDRLFSALVSTWSTRGQAPDERAALEWLEQQAPPQIEASDFEPRRVAISYVPPNDPTGKPEVLPERRRRQARFFPAAIPHCPLVRFRWSIDPPEPAAFDALQSIARDVPYLGHSASLVRCRFIDTVPKEPDLKRSSAKRCIYPGRFQILERAYKSGGRPPQGEIVAGQDDASGSETPRSVFSQNWILLEDNGGDCPDLRAIAGVARQVRRAFLHLYGDAPAPEFISGHQPDESPSLQPHLAILPLADVGWRYSVGRLMGLALVLPFDIDQRRVAAEQNWLAGADDTDGAVQAWQTFDHALNDLSTLKLGGLGVWNLFRTLQPTKKSLELERYTRAARRWATVTPLVLDRFPKAKSPEERDEEIASIIASSCENIGLPKPSRVRTFKHAAVKGAPSAYPSGNAPKWTGWTLPDFLAHRLLMHALVEFEQPVRGPIILGAGRYSGLGMCMGVQDEHSGR
jgi:CRISPR-associated protein Csb2